MVADDSAASTVGAVAANVSSWHCVCTFEKATGVLAETRVGATSRRQTERKSLRETVSAQSGQRDAVPASSHEVWNRSAHGKHITWPQL